jgi:hypothetical protein
MKENPTKTGDYLLNLAKIQVLSTRFGKYKSSADNDKVVCELCVKANFKEFEKQFMLFNETFIRKHIINYLPVVHKIFAFVHEEAAEGEPPLPETMATAYINGERGYYKLVAKYYLEPNKKARVMYFDNEYYAKHLADNNLENIDEDQMVELKSLPVADRKQLAKGYEKEMWEYCDCFVVKGSACCHSDDKFDRLKGRRIAMLRAMYNAANRVRNLVNDMNKLITDENRDMREVLHRPQLPLADFNSYFSYCENREYKDIDSFDSSLKNVFKGNLETALKD